MQAAKRIRRKELIKVLSGIPKSVIEQESMIVAIKVIDTVEFRKSKSVSIFLNSPREISTFDIMVRAFELNKKVYVPLCDGTDMKMVRLEDLEDYLSLPRNSWDIPEPLVTENRESTMDLDLVVMPGLGFDKEGNRIGFGKGYYDSFLSKCFQNAKASGLPKPSTIAVALTGQMVDKVPVDANDIKPDRIITAIS